MTPRFYFATCQVGAEKAVKSEILATQSHLKFAFSRPGFITFKEDDDSRKAISQVESVFVRLWGMVVGQAKDLGVLNEMLGQLPERSIVHAFERDTFVPGDEPRDYIFRGQVKKVIGQLSPLVRERLRWDETPSVGEKVFNLIWVDEFLVFLGTHVHSADLDSAPGNQPLLKLPEDSPSRAYLKIAEAVHRFKPKIEKGASALEVGCSPGGASLAMINWGMKVTGIDPKFMDRRFNSEPNFHFIQKIAKVVTPEELRGVNPSWLLMDMNIAPLEAIDELTHVLLTLRKVNGPQLKLKHGFLTLKLNDWKFVDKIPLYLKRLEECGFRDLVAMQLNSNRQEFFVFAQSFK